MTFAVVGHGVVGRHMVRDIEGAGQEVVIYDPYQSEYAETQSRVNDCDCAFICVPTPASKGGFLDMGAVYNVYSWLNVPVSIIRSATALGTADALETEGHRLVVCPEFIGEGVRPPYNAMRQPPFMIIGGSARNQELAVQALSRIYNSECGFVFVSAIEAEIAKLVENYFLALKVTWANEVYEICNQFDASYPRMMNALTHDYRIGRSHTHVYADNRGWSSKCFDKDVPGLLAEVGPSVAPLLAGMIAVNEWHKSRSKL